MSLARRTSLEVRWFTTERGPDVLLALDGEGRPRDIARELGEDLLQLTHVDNLTGTADTLTLDVQDRDHRWSGDWKPVFGDAIEASIIVDEGEAWLTGVERLVLGRFSHDKITLSGPPARASISAVSAPLATGLRRTKRTRTWSGRTLVGIAEDITDRAGLNLDWIGSDSLTYKRREQKDKSDLEFLEELCTEVGRTLKLTKEPERDRWMIVISPESENDSRASVGELDLNGGNVISWTFDGDDSARYGNCHLKFFDPRTNKTIPGEFPPPGTSDADRIAMGLDPDGQTLEVRLPVDDGGHAIEICKGKLRAANQYAATGHLVTLGDPGLVAGVTFDLVNAFGFEGRYIITRAEHRAIGGYTCSLDVRKTVTGF